MKNTKRIKEGTKLTVIWDRELPGTLSDPTVYEYNVSNGKFYTSDKRECFNNEVSVKTVEELIEYINSKYCGLMIKDEDGIVEWYGIQEPVFKY